MPGDLGDGQPADRQGPRRRHGAVLGQVPARSSRTCSRATTSPRTDASTVISQERMNVIHKESLCINCGCCVSECNAMESDPEFLGPQALAKAMRFVGDPRDGAKRRAARGATTASTGIWECTRCYFCNERCPKGVDPRDAIAKLGAEAIKRRDRPRHGREARQVVRHLGEDDRLAARDRARAEDAGHRRVDQADEVRDRPRAARQGAAAVPAARREGRRRVAPLHNLVHEQDRERRAGIVQGEHALAKLAHGHVERRSTRPTPAGRVPAAVPPGRTSGDRGDRDEEGRVLQGLPRLALGEGARHLDPGARAEGRARARSSSSRSPAAAPATSTRPSPTTTCT